MDLMRGQAVLFLTLSHGQPNGASLSTLLAHFAEVSAAAALQLEAETMDDIS